MKKVLAVMSILVFLILGVGIYFIFFNNYYSIDEVDVYSFNKSFSTLEYNVGGNSYASCMSGQKAVKGNCNTNEPSDKFYLTDPRGLVSTDITKSYKNSYECNFMSTEPGNYSFYIEVYCYPKLTN